MKMQVRKHKAVARPRRERLNLEANYHEVGIPAVVAAIIPGKQTEEPEMPPKPVKEFPRD